MKKVIVTGGGGFVGSYIVKQLLALGVECLVIGRNEYPEIEALGARCLRGDICDFSLLTNSFRGVDTVFHVAALAGIWGPWKHYYQVNVVGTANVIRACQANGVSRLIYTSTPSVVFNGNDIVNGDESLPYARKFLCNYARSKVMAEKLVLENTGRDKTLHACALRPHLVWGPGDPHLIPRILDRGRKRELKKIGNCDNLVDISYVENVADAHLLAAANLETTKNASGKAYFISQGEPVNLWEWIDELFRVMDVPPIQKSIPFTLAYCAGAMLEGVHRLFAVNKEPKMTRFLAEQLAKSHYFSISRATYDLGYLPRISTAEGMKRLQQSFTEKQENQVQ